MQSVVIPVVQCASWGLLSFVAGAVFWDVMERRNAVKLTGLVELAIDAAESTLVDWQQATAEADAWRTLAHELAGELARVVGR